MTEKATARTGQATDHGEIRARLDDMLGRRTSAEIALVTRMVQGFEAKASRLVKEFDAAVASGDPEMATRAAHTLKGTALNLGLTGLAEACRRLEAESAHAGESTASLRDAVVAEADRGRVLLAGEASRVLYGAGA